MKKIKICGLRREEDIHYVNQEVPDYIGFVFAKSKRQITIKQAGELRSMLKEAIIPVGVFVNEPIDNILHAVKCGAISMIQLHGDETEQTIRSLKQNTDIPIVKAIRVQSRDDIRLADELPCDYLLLDTYQTGAYGGTGKMFSWELIPDRLSHPYFLAGGLNENNIRLANSLACYGFDVSGGVETDGSKDYEKIKSVISAVRKGGYDK